MIFVFIAATYTPFCLSVLGDAWGIPLLVAVWSSAALGVVFKVARPEVSRWLGIGLYLGVGWLAFVAAWPLAHRAPEALPGLLSEGLLFSAGSVVHAFRRPDPFPRVFGYHEIFHRTRDRRRRHQLGSDCGLRASALAPTSNAVGSASAGLPPRVRVEVIRRALAMRAARVAVSLERPSLAPL